MPTNPNMVAIQTVTVGAGGAASIDFTNIPQTYTDLIFKGSVMNSQGIANTITVAFNNSTANFSGRWLEGNGSSVASGNTTNWIASSNDVTSTPSNWEVYIPNYTSSNNKSYSTDSVVEANATLAYATLIAGLWSNTSAINRVTFTQTGSNFRQNSQVTLYGVTSAQGLATGGFVTQDANYYYHTFTSSGTFTPKQNLACDILVVAGGGAGGGGARGAGGGAGGLQGFTSQSLTVQNYTVTVGGGGTVGAYSNDPVSANTSTSGSNSQFGSLTASVGGGRGGMNDQSADGSGGSGGSGGGAWYTNTAGTGTTGQGNNGGTAATTPNYGSGGGGGAGGVGANGTTAAGGNGGVGSSAYSSWGSATSTGQNVSGTRYYAGGGGGGLYNSASSPGSGGLGGGGTGNNTSPTGQSGTAGTANTGGGGGSGGSGGSGIVIVRYSK